MTTGVTVTGAGWAAKIYAGYSELKFSPGSKIEGIVCMGIWDSDSANANIGIRDISVTLPLTAAGWFSGTTPTAGGAKDPMMVRCCQGSSSHVAGISFWAVIKQ
jgi:hypothetical protein